MKANLLFALCALFFVACQQQNAEFTSFKIQCELVAKGVRPMALHYAEKENLSNASWNSFKSIAEDYGVQLHQEKQLPENLLLAPDTAQGKTMVIIYRHNRLEQYLRWKEDVLNASNDDFNTKDKLARRLGRLLGYSPLGVNLQLRNNSDYRDLHSFGVKRQITHLYYDDVQSARVFYQEKLGLRPFQDNRFQISKDGFIVLHPFDEFHTAGEPKSTAIALLTNQLPKWYAHLQEENVPIKYSYKPKKGGPHDGFVAIDPGGYLLEFEEFKQHPENELFMAILSKSPRMETILHEMYFFGTITWTYHNDLLKMQQFYEEVLGYRLVADQGWTKIYQTADASFIGLVDERRGMEDYAEKKAVEIEWDILDYKGYETYLEWHGSNITITGPEKYSYRIGELSDQKP